MTKMLAYTVYKIINKVNNNYYVGSHITENPYDDYMGSGNLIKNAIKKYGILNFEKQIIFMAFDEHSMKWAEDQFIVTNKIDPMSYNINPYGTRPPSERTEQHKRNIGKANKGNKRPDVSKRMKNDPYNLKEKFTGGNNPFSGKKHTKKYLVSMSQKNSGKNNPMYGSKYIRINDGKINKRFTGKVIPDGFVLGWIK